MGIFELITILSALISIIAALYARKAWKEAHRSNEIILFCYRKEIYDAFVDLRMHMLITGRSADTQKVSQFFYPSRNSSLYFNEDLSKDIREFYECCFTIADMSRLQSSLSAQENAKINAALHFVTDTGQSIENRIQTVIHEKTINR